MILRIGDALLKQTHAISPTESEVALFIGQQFQKYASYVRGAGRDSKRLQSIRDALARPDALKGEREKLIRTGTGALLYSVAATTQSGLVGVSTSAF